MSAHRYFDTCEEMEAAYDEGDADMKRLHGEIDALRAELARANERAETYREEREAARDFMENAQKERDKALASLAREREAREEAEREEAFVRDQWKQTIAAHEATKRELEDYKRAVSEKLRFNMAAILTGTPEQLLRDERDAALSRAEAAQALASRTLSREIGACNLLFHKARWAQAWKRAAKHWRAVDPEDARDTEEHANRAIAEYQDRCDRLAAENARLKARADSAFAMWEMTCRIINPLITPDRTDKPTQEEFSATAKAFNAAWEGIHSVKNFDTETSRAVLRASDVPAPGTVIVKASGVAPLTKDDWAPDEAPTREDAPGGKGGQCSHCGVDWDKGCECVDGKRVMELPAAPETKEGEG